MILALAAKCFLDVQGGGILSLILSFHLFILPLNEQKRALIVNAIGKFLLFCIILVILSLWSGVGPIAILKGVTKYALIYFFYIWGTIGRIISKKWIVIIVALEIIYVLFQYIFDAGVFSYHVTPNGTFTSSNNLAAFILLGSLLYFSDLRIHIGALFISAVLLDSMIVSASFALAFLASRNFFSIKSIGLVIVLSLVGLFFFERFLGQLEIVLSQDWSQILENKARGMGSGVWRLWAWTEYIEIWTIDWSSFLFGTGLQSTNKMSPDFVGSIVGQDPHNSYLSLFIEHGLIAGLIILNWLFRGFDFSSNSNKAIVVFVFFASFGTNILVSVPFMILLSYYKGNLEHVRNLSLQQK